MTHPSFDSAANLILDSIEKAFEIEAKNGRQETYNCVVKVLEYYCTPKPGAIPWKRPEVTQ